jgi:hypothetical protein
MRAGPVAEIRKEWRQASDGAKAFFACFGIITALLILLGLYVQYWPGVSN